MGRRSRKRRATMPVETARAEGAASAAEAIAEPPPPLASERAAPARDARSARAPRRARRDEPPRPPWHPFPLAELCILIAMVMGVVGFVTWGARGQLLLAGAMTLGSAATLEFTLREHLSGYRSHSTLLGGVVAAAAGAALFATGVSRPVVLVVAAALFVGGLVAFRELFKRRSGGLAWRGGLR
jgi:hypothetical protein